MKNRYGALLVCALVCSMSACIFGMVGGSDVASCRGDTVDQDLSIWINLVKCAGDDLRAGKQVSSIFSTDILFCCTDLDSIILQLRGQAASADAYFNRACTIALKELEVECQKRDPKRGSLYGKNVTARAILGAKKLGLGFGALLLAGKLFITHREALVRFAQLVCSGISEAAARARPHAHASSSKNDSGK